MNRKDGVNLSWDDFIKLGNPDNCETETPTDENFDIENELKFKSKVRIYKERKDRGGKTVSIIKGLKPFDLDIAKKLLIDLKKALGLGGTIDGETLVLNGDQGKTIETWLNKRGFKDVKLGN